MGGAGGGEKTKQNKKPREQEVKAAKQENPVRPQWMDGLISDGRTDWTGRCCPPFDFGEVDVEYGRGRYGRVEIR